jgi:FkbM family methyltransferase
VSIKGAVLSLSRKVQFKGKATLLDRLGIGASNKHVVPSDVKSVRCIEGITMVTSCTRDVMFRELYVHGVYQDDVLVALRNLLRPGDVFWDIGANYGLMSIYVDRCFGGQVQTVAFEPNPSVAEELRRNIGVNGCRSIDVEELCLSNEIGTAKFYTSADHSWNATLIKQFASSTGEDIEIEVPTSTLDECVRRITPPSVIKLDVEGAEHLVVEGGREFLSATRVPMVVEYNLESIRDSGLTPEEYLSLFREMGYAVHLIRRPLWGSYRWRDLFRVKDDSAIPSLCNLVLLLAD